MPVMLRTKAFPSIPDSPYYATWLSLIDRLARFCRSQKSQVLLCPFCLQRNLLDDACGTKWPKVVYVYGNHYINDKVLNSAQLSCHCEWLVFTCLFAVCIFVDLRMPLPVGLTSMSRINGVHFLNTVHPRFWSWEGTRRTYSDTENVANIEEPSIYIRKYTWYIRSEAFTAVTMKNSVFWDIKTQFVLHRRHITSPLQSPAG
jgi:hypothetical protein